MNQSLMDTMDTHVQFAMSASLGVDCISVLTPQNLKAIRAAGHRFCVRYLGITMGASRALTAAEASLIRGSGLALIPAQFAQQNQMSAAQGATDGANAVAQARAVGIPPGVTMFCKLERTASFAAKDVLAYCDAWKEQVNHAGGYTAGVHVGAETGLNEEQLSSGLDFQHYWRSSGPVPGVSRGYHMIQLHPYNQKVGGVAVNVVVTQLSYDGWALTWWGPTT